MSKHFVKFIDNRKAIEDRVLGAVTRYFLVMDTRTDEVTGEGLQKIHVGSSASENIAYCYRAAMQCVETYFNRESTSGSWSDFQCSLAMSIFNDYVKK